MQWLLFVPPVHMTAANTQHCPYFTGLYCVPDHILRISALPDQIKGLMPSLKSPDHFPANTPLSSSEFTCLERQRDYICNESCPWPSVWLPPEVIHPLHWLPHYKDCFVSLWTTFPMLHLTDYTLSPATNHTHYITPTQILLRSLNIV